MNKNIITMFLRDQGFIENKYGYFVKMVKGSMYRYKISDTFIRFETYIFKTWIRLRSAKIKNIYIYKNKLVGLKH